MDYAGRSKAVSIHIYAVLNWLSFQNQSEIIEYQLRLPKARIFQFKFTLYTVRPNTALQPTPLSGRFYRADFSESLCHLSSWLSPGVRLNASRSGAHNVSSTSICYLLYYQGLRTMNRQ